MCMKRSSSIGQGVSWQSWDTAVVFFRSRMGMQGLSIIITSCFLFSFVWQWTDGFYSRMFLGNTTLVSLSLSRIVDSLGAYIQRLTGVKTTISIAYSNCILATGTLMIILPLIILYLFAQRQFVESISSTGIKM